MSLTPTFFGRWTVLAKTGRFWLVRCICGTQKEVRSSVLLAGGSRSCGCARNHVAIGQVYGRWIVIAKMGLRSLVRCSCGTEKVITSTSLLDGHSRSCGCLNRELTGTRSRTHGRSRGDRTYRSWCSMRTRCTNQKRKEWHRYGGRGIAVCERWMVFENFLADMGERPAGKTLDRYPDKDGNYEPDNCRWATFREQANNSAGRKSFAEHEETQVLWLVSDGGYSEEQVAAMFNVNRATIYRTINRSAHRKEIS